MVFHIEETLLAEGVSEWGAEGGKWGLTGKRWQGSGQDYMKNNFGLCTVHQMSFG
jgi:hypothetical protein